jgi:cell division protein FtsL
MEKTFRTTLAFATILVAATVLTVIATPLAYAQEGLDVDANTNKQKQVLSGFVEAEQVNENCITLFDVENAC